MDPRPQPLRRHIAFLRAINVGGHTVKMDRLRELFEEIGLLDVSTFIASGNAAFEASGEAADLERRIEEHLERSLGYEVATFLRSPGELAAVAEHEPFPPGEEFFAVSVAFLKAPPGEEARERVMGLRSEVDEFHVRGREVYWGCRIRTSDSKFSGAALDRALGGPVTIRNATTVRKLAAKHPAAR